MRILALSGFVPEHICDAVRLEEEPTESKVEEYKKIFENDEWILEGKGL